MKIQTRQSIFSSVIFGIVFIIISFLVYYSYSHNLKSSLNQNLTKTAHIIALFHLEEDELNAKEFQNVKKQFSQILSETTYQVYNENHFIVFGKKGSAVATEILQQIKQDRELFFETEHEIGYGIYYEDNQGNFIIITQESKQVLAEQLVPLIWILSISLCVGLFLIVILSRLLSKIAYKPIRNVIEQVHHIVPDNPENQIELPQTSDEIQELIETFNTLLKKVSETFIIQKKFVNYVSHEFKTPLASMLGHLEVFSIKDRTPAEYEQLSNKLIEQIHQLEDILNTLISISDLRKKSDIISTFRIDELIWEIVEKISIVYPQAKISVQNNILAKDENKLNVTLQRTQLFMALFNIIENATKYSEGKNVEIIFFQDDSTLKLVIRDHGIGIPKEEISKLTQPLFRANNTILSQIKGNGIGLSIAMKIFENNKIKYTIESTEDDATTVTILFGV